MTSGCATHTEGLTQVINPLDDDGRTTSALVKNDPSGAIKAPRLPEDLLQRAEQAAQADASTAPATGATTVSYHVEITTGGVASLESAFNNASLLARLADKKPASQAGLEQRMHSDLSTAKEVLHSQGYYNGTVTGRVELQTPKKAAVHIVFTPGEQYSLGTSRIRIKKADTSFITPHELDGANITRVRGQLETSPGTIPEKLPETLDDVGVSKGAPALAATVLGAVEAVRDRFKNSGYPFAEIAGTKYIVDHSEKTLETVIVIAAGPFSLMGGIETHGEVTVNKSYLQSAMTWKEGEPWNQSKVEAYRSTLRRSGLFSDIELQPSQQATAEGLRNIVTTLSGSPERTVSGQVKYDSDFGIGVQGAWEHRNLTGNGDLLRVTLPLWQDLQMFQASYRLPYFMRPDQALIAQSAITNEDSDAYQLRSFMAQAGIERNFSDTWRGTVMLRAEGGDIKDNDKPRRSFSMFGTPIEVTYDTTNDILNATTGGRANLSVAPYTGEYGSPFSVLRTRVDAQYYQPVVGEDRLILATRGSVGSLTGATAQKVPPSARFYSGGGGSVRGYAYQSLGPRNSDDDPQGGASLVEVSAEARLKITPEWGLVAFIDGGSAFEDQSPDFKEEMRWGAGGGIRYYTAIGPVRFDIATPLNPRSDDDALQYYISIGQSF